MKRRVEAVVLELERENRRLAAQVRRLEGGAAAASGGSGASAAESAASSEATTATATATATTTASPAAVPFLSVGECADFFHATLETHVAPYVVPSAVADSSTKSRLLLDSAYAAFCLLVCVEGLAPSTPPCTLFALLAWTTEVALAAFFDAATVKDAHEGHAKAFWAALKHTAFSAAHPAVAHEQPHALQRAARSAWRESEAKEFDCQAYREKMFDEARRVVEASVSVPFVLNAGCLGAIAHFPPHHHHHHHPFATQPSPRRGAHR